MSQYEGIAGYGHIAVGLASGRLFGDTRRSRSPWIDMAACIALAWLPDVDVLWVSLGAPDRGLGGHRGLTHTPVFALLIGLAVALYVWRRVGSGALRLGMLATLLVASHGILDAIARDGRGILFLWPLSMQRFHLPWRPLPDAPVGWALFTRVGLSHVATEFILFLPVTIFALGRRFGVRLTATGRRG